MIFLLTTKYCGISLILWYTSYHAKEKSMYESNTEVLDRMVTGIFMRLL